MNQINKALRYVKNAGGNPNMDWLIEDFEPIGKQLLSDLLKKGWAIITVEKEVILTALGETRLEAIGNG